MWKSGNDFSCEIYLSINLFELNANANLLSMRSQIWKIRIRIEVRYINFVLREAPLRARGWAAAVIGTQLERRVQLNRR